MIPLVTETVVAAKLEKPFSDSPPSSASSADKFADHLRRTPPEKPRRTPSPAEPPRHKLHTPGRRPEGPPQERTYGAPSSDAPSRGAAASGESPSSKPIDSEASPAPETAPEEQTSGEGVALAPPPAPPTPLPEAALPAKQGDLPQSEDLQGDPSAAPLEKPAIPGAATGETLPAELAPQAPIAAGDEEANSEGEKGPQPDLASSSAGATAKGGETPPVDATVRCLAPNQAIYRAPEPGVPEPGAPEPGTPTTASASPAAATESAPEPPAAEAPAGAASAAAPSSAKGDASLAAQLTGKARPENSALTSAENSDLELAAESLLEEKEEADKTSDEAPSAKGDGKSEPHAARQEGPAMLSPADAAQSAASTLPAHLRKHMETHSSGPRAPQGGGTLNDAQHARLLQRVSRAFRAAEEGGGEVRIRLSPPELGSMKLELSLQSGVLMAKLEVETQRAQAILLDSLSTLRERLAEQGIRVEKFDVGLQQRDSGGQQPQQQSPESRQSARFAPARSRGAEETPPPDSRAPLRPLVDPARLNIIV